MLLAKNYNIINVINVLYTILLKFTFINKLRQSSARYLNY